MLQWALAEALGDDTLVVGQIAQWGEGRAGLRASLAAHGLVAMPGAATWFTCIDLAASGIADDDRALADALVREAGVATIPLSALWEGEGAPRHILRLCHAKPPAMLAEAAARIAQHCRTL